MRIKAHKMITKKIVLFLLLIGFQLSAQTKKWTLEECVDYAIKNNISVKQSELDLKTSDIEKLEYLSETKQNAESIGKSSEEIEYLQEYGKTYDKWE